MSTTDREAARNCVSCGVSIAAMSAARFPCPQCGERIYRCKRCRKQGTRYSCTSCSFEGP